MRWFGRALRRRELHFEWLGLLLEAVKSQPMLHKAWLPQGAFSDGQAARQACLRQRVVCRGQQDWAGRSRPSLAAGGGGAGGSAAASCDH